jgi:hypothetical protein
VGNHILLAKLKAARHISLGVWILVGAAVAVVVSLVATLLGEDTLVNLLLAAAAMALCGTAIADKLAREKKDRARAAQRARANLIRAFQERHEELKRGFGLLVAGVPEAALEAVARRFQHEEEEDTGRKSDRMLSLAARSQQAMIYIATEQSQVRLAATRLAEVRRQVLRFLQPAHQTPPSHLPDAGKMHWDGGVDVPELTQRLSRVGASLNALLAEIAWVGSADPAHHLPEYPTNEELERWRQRLAESDQPLAQARIAASAFAIPL